MNAGRAQKITPERAAERALWRVQLRAVSLRSCKEDPSDSEALVVDEVVPEGGNSDRPWLLGYPTFRTGAGRPAPNPDEAGSRPASIPNVGGPRGGSHGRSSREFSPGQMGGWRWGRVGRRSCGVWSWLGPEGRRATFALTMSAALLGPERARADELTHELCFDTQPEARTGDPGAGSARSSPASLRTSAACRAGAALVRGDWTVNGLQGRTLVALGKSCRITSHYMTLRLVFAGAWLSLDKGE